MYLHQFWLYLYPEWLSYRKAKQVDTINVYIMIANIQPRMKALLALVLVAVSTPAVLYALGAICNFTAPFQIFAVSLQHHVSHNTLLYPFLTLMYTPLNLGYFFTLWKTHK